MNNNFKLRDNINQLKDIGISIFPKNKTEFLLLITSICIYFSFSSIIARNTLLVEGTPTITYDLYFSFDNAQIFHYGFQNLEGHPLFKYFTLPFISIENAIAAITGLTKGKVFFIILICNYMIASSVLYIYRYLKFVVELKGYKLNLIVFFFAFSSTSLTLSFTFESFTFKLYRILLFFKNKTKMQINFVYKYSFCNKSWRYNNNEYSERAHSYAFYERI